MKKWIFLAWCAGTVHAQVAKDYDVHLDNGAEVVYQTFSAADPRDPAPNLGTARAFGDTIERNVMDAQNVRQLGFQLQIQKLPGDPIRFRVSMGPMDKWAFFGWSAAPRVIQNGDRVMLDVLEDPVTKRKIFDSFQVGIGVGLHVMPVAKTVPRAPATGATMRLQTPDLTEGKTLLGSNSSVISGPSLSLHLAGKPAFTFSTQPESGFRMEAIAEGNVLMFVSGSERYDIQCSAPVIDGPGAWYLWVRRDAPGASPNAAPNLPALNLVAP